MFIDTRATERADFDGIARFDDRSIGTSHDVVGFARTELPDTVGSTIERTRPITIRTEDFRRDEKIVLPKLIKFEGFRM